MFAERLCNPDGSAPTRASTHYLYKGKCRALKDFNAGQLAGKPLRYKTSVHGPVIGTATVGGKPYALSRKRSTFGRDGLNLAALHDMTAGKATTPQKFWKAANQFGFTFNWAYASRKATAYFTSGRLPKRARGLDRRLPTLGTGKYEWKGFLRAAPAPARRERAERAAAQLEQPARRRASCTATTSPTARSSTSSCSTSSRSGPRSPTWSSVMNRAATEDVRSPVWPVVSKVLHGGAGAERARPRRSSSILDDWVRRDAPRLDADNDGLYDEPGPAIMDAVWRPIAEAVMRPRARRPARRAWTTSAASAAWPASPTSTRTCARCSAGTVRGQVQPPLLRQGLAERAAARRCGRRSTRRRTSWRRSSDPDPTKWLTTAARTSFIPGLIPNTMRATNRPTFQQVLEFQSR